MTFITPAPAIQTAFYVASENLKGTLSIDAFKTVNCNSGLIKLATHLIIGGGRENPSSTSENHVDAPAPFDLGNASIRHAENNFSHWFAKHRWEIRSRKQRKIGNRGRKQ